MKRILWLTADCFFDCDHSLVEYLQKDVSIRWIVLQSNNRITLPKKYNYDVWQLHYKMKDPRTLFEVLNYLKSLRHSVYDLIYSDSLGIMYYTALLYWAKEIPIVHAAHNVIPYSVWGWSLRLEVKYIFNRCEHFQMFSHHTAKWFAQHYAQKSFFYAPLVVKDFGRVTTDKYVIDKRKLNLLFFGNVVGNKRLDLLIAAIKELPTDMQSKIHLNICGNCQNKDFFLQQIDGCDAITAYFHRIPDEEIPELFTKHQFLMLPYEDVAQSGPHMIAYYYNLPVIASNIDGFKERVDDGINGFLFKSGDINDLKAKIIQAVSMTERERQTMKSNLMSFSQDNFSIESVSQKYIEYFNTIAK